MKKYPHQPQLQLDKNALFGIELLYAGIDVFIIFIAAFVAYYGVHHQFPQWNLYLPLAILGTSAYVIVQYINKLYSLHLKYSIYSRVLRILMAVFGMLCFCIALLFFMKISAEFSRLWMLTWGATSCVVATIYHSLFRKIFYQKIQGYYARQVILVGDVSFIQKTYAVLTKRGTKVVGFYIIDETEAPHISLPVERIFDGDDALDFCQIYNVTDVVLSIENMAPSHKKKVLHMFLPLPVNVFYCLSDVLQHNGIFQLYNDWLDCSAVLICKSPLSTHGRAIKRGIDITLSFVLILLLSTPMLIIAFLVKLTSRGPAFFRQLRGGLGKQPMYMIKFRTMTVLDNGLKTLKQVEKNDSRVTCIGRFLRKTSIDELPQLFNVLLGEMSLVGPRPHALSHDEEYAQLIDEYAARHRIKPGMTGWAQIHGLRGETKTMQDMNKRITYDLFYIENWSLLLDFKILCLTPFTIFSAQSY